MNKNNFKRKYMHPTRRKLVDMIKTGEYEKDTKLGWSKKTESHEVGDKWEDESHKYEKKDGYTIKTSKNNEVLTKIRDYLKSKSTCSNPSCSKTIMTNADKKLIHQTGYCVDCLARIETDVKLAGIWEEYQQYKIWGKMLVEGRIKIEQMEQSYEGLKQNYDYVNEDGTLETWVMPQNVDEAKVEMLEVINKFKDELAELEEKRNNVLEIIKEKNYEHVL